MPQHATEYQRELMRKLFRELGGDDAAVCAAYAKAEADGVVFRKRGDYLMPSEDYARALLAHGRSAGWLFQGQTGERRDG